MTSRNVPHLPASHDSRRHWRSALLIAASLLFGTPTLAAESGAGASSMAIYDDVRFVAHLADLPADLAWMQKHDKPMMLFFHASYCGYCQRIDDEFLIPMRLDPDYQGRMIIRRVQIDSDDRFVDVDGNWNEPAAFADELDVRGVPYVLFFSPDGERIGEITGAAPAFYSHYLERNIDRAERCAKDMSAPECREFIDRPGLK
ncbi:thioredoxin family protein [Guyparkeria sp. GHLCS8-2]|uniref:thioredoxin family protein n=1 Tax=Guyparkeria halopsychrophila TaxID=3139421 RepID=UPI0037C52D73